MRTSSLLLPLSFLLATTLAAQEETREEYTKSKGGTDMIVKGNTHEMYDGTKSEKAQALYDQAVEEHLKGDLANAKKTYAKAIKEDPGFVEAYDNLGQVHRQDNEYDLAIKNYKKSIELYPQGQMARQNLAVVYSIQGDHLSAMKEYEALLSYDPENAEGYFGLANSFMMQQKLDEALKNAKKALSIYQATNSHHLSDAHYMLGLIHYYRQESEDARTHLQKAKDMGAKIHPQVDQEVFGTAQSKSTGKMETAEDYEALIPQVINAFDWLHRTPVGQEPEKRQEISAFLIQWVVGSPLVTIEISEKIVPYVDQPECRVIFLGGFTKYMLQFKKDVPEANLYATERVLEFYEANKKELGKHKELEKFLKMEKDNKLKKHIRSNS